jgi:hypothetical protein
LVEQLSQTQATLQLVTTQLEHDLGKSTEEPFLEKPVGF